jgi:DNA-3-methyladenine glycosylase I
MPQRCPWSSQSPLESVYHDSEWGVPVHDDQRLFEFLILEGAQAGLSWSTILKKRDDYRRAFDGFDPQRIACYTDRRIEKLLADPGIVRNRLKVHSAVTNARAFLELQSGHGSFSDYLWGFVDGRPLQNAWRRMDQVPTSTPLSDQLSRDLKKRGFRFVGTTICYAFIQAVGLVNDHLVDCFRHAEVGNLGKQER